jgi:hypothetical protein
LSTQIFQHIVSENLLTFGFSLLSMNDYLLQPLLRAIAAGDDDAAEAAVSGLSALDGAALPQLMHLSCTGDLTSAGGACAPSPSWPRNTPASASKRCLPC